MNAGMPPERWRQVTDIFHAARRRAGDERIAYLDAACGDDIGLRRDVDRMLAADAAAGRLGDEPLVDAMLAAVAEPALASGAQVGPYRVTGVLGVGGMGEVYRAHDPRLDRDVAIKILPPAFAADAERLARFRHEARVLAALSHPHIAAIYDVHTREGVEHLILELVEGDTLRGPVGVAAALEYGRQIAEALSAAHAKGIVHRDLKPGNVTVTPDGLVKVLDFGLASDASRSEEAAGGAVVGSPAYMSPEQTRGDRVDVRTDVWAFGCLLFELLTGRQAFDGDTLSATMHAVRHDAPEWALLPRRTPPALRRVLRACLEKDPADRPASIGDVHRTIVGIQRSTGLWRVAAIAAAVVGIAALGAGLMAQRGAARARWARDVALPQLMQFIAADEYSQAFALAGTIQRITPGDPVLATLWPQFSAAISLTTLPDDADVFVQAYATADRGWQHLGRTPLTGVRLPLGVFQFRIEKEGYEPRMLAATNPSTLLGNATNRLASPVDMSLVPSGSGRGMVQIPGGAFPVSLNAFSTTDPIRLDPYMIDALEVTNAQYLQFVEAGGYAHPDYWADLPFEVAGQAVSWHEAVTQFRDTTAVQGPATWASGRYAAETADHPVAGVSWYEAVAYCRFRGQTLPTLYHWRRAALSPDEMFSPMAPSVIAASNFRGDGPAAVGTFKGIGPYGTYDMAGNVREWSWNEAQPGSRWIQGGAWPDPAYMLVVPDGAPASDRSPTNGFRCAQYSGTLPDVLLSRVDRPFRQNRSTAAVPELFEVFTRQYSPITAALNQRVDAIDTTNADWIREKVSFDAGYEDSRVAAYLFTPRNANPPYQTVVYFPGRTSFIGRSGSDTLQPDFLDFVVRSGRALVWPIYKGSYERWIPTSAPSTEQQRLLFAMRQDLGRVLDVLAQRSDIDAERVAYLGLSYGASVPLPLLALEHRFRAVVLMSAGRGGVPGFADPDALDYFSRITAPVLMLSGRHDFVFPLETVARPLFASLGTPDDQKRHVVFDAGHMMFPRGPMIQEVLEWLNRHLGPVGPR